MSKTVSGGTGEKSGWMVFQLLNRIHVWQTSIAEEFEVPGKQFLNCLYLVFIGLVSFMACFNFCTNDVMSSG